MGESVSEGCVAFLHLCVCAAMGKASIGWRDYRDYAPIVWSSSGEYMITHKDLNDLAVKKIKDEAQK